MAHPGGRPPIYGAEIIERAKEYLAMCKDVVEDGKLVRVEIPSKGGMASYLNVSRESLYAWAKEYPEFSDIMEQMGAEQEKRLMNNGLSGAYNSTIAKVLLTKHGYREGLDQTTNDKDLPQPILGNVIKD